MPAALSDKETVVTKLGEVFREYGYHGASLSHITQATGLGKGSLYHYFPNGKEDMARSVLQHIHNWFEAEIFSPLRGDAALEEGIAQMFRAVRDYFRNGNRICLLGAFALYDTRDMFAVEIRRYFEIWWEAMQSFLCRRGMERGMAEQISMQAMIIIQGALVLAHATGKPALFDAALAEQERLIIASFCIR